MKNWVINETSTSYFGDERLSSRFELILDQVSERPFESLPASLKGNSETMAAYRFWNNDKVRFDKVLSPHSNASLSRIEREEVILAVQDTTSLDYTTKKSGTKLGHLESENHRGLFLHPTLLVNPQGISLGIYSAKVWTRDINDIGKKDRRKQLPIEQKESYHWIESYHDACEIADKYPDKIIVSVGDREYDIYETFVEANKTGNNAELVLRAAQNRRTIPMYGDEIELLWDALESSPIIGKVKVHIPRSKDRKGRNVLLNIRIKEIFLKAPARKSKEMPDVKIYAVMVNEKKPPAGIEPIEWLLLTTLQITDLESAVKILKYYRCRWQIEIFFKILKSGCKVEELQLEEQYRLEPCIALYMIIAWRVLFLVMLGRKCPDLPAEAVFDKDECEILYIMKNKKKPPNQSPKLNYVLKMIASFGGYLGRKNDGEPGPKHIWIGLRRLADFTDTYKQIKELQTCV